MNYINNTLFLGRQVCSTLPYPYPPTFFNHPVLNNIPVSSAFTVTFTLPRQRDCPNTRKTTVHPPKPPAKFSVRRFFPAKRHRFGTQWKSRPDFSVQISKNPIFSVQTL